MKDRKFPTPAEEIDFINCRFIWWTIEIVLVVFGGTAVIIFIGWALDRMDLIERPYGEYAAPVTVLCLYLLATVLSIVAGWMLKKWFYPEDREYYNRVYHKWVVLVINGGMGVACVVYLFISPLSQAILPLAILGGSAVIYTLTWALKIIRPHSFWARFRSVIMRMIILTIITGVVYQYMYFIMPVVAVPVLIFTWRNLRRDQKTAGWPNR